MNNTIRKIETDFEVLSATQKKTTFNSHQQGINKWQLKGYYLNLKNISELTLVEVDSKPHIADSFSLDATFIIDDKRLSFKRIHPNKVLHECWNEVLRDDDLSLTEAYYTSKGNMIDSLLSHINLEEFLEILETY